MKFDKAIRSLELRFQHIEKYIDENKVNQKTSSRIIEKTIIQFQDKNRLTNYFAQDKQVMQGRRMNELEIVLNVHRKRVKEI